MKLKAYLSSLSAKQKWKYGVLAAAAVLLTAAVIALIPWFMKVASPENMERITRWLKGIEPFGFIILFAVQLLQIVIAVIPGEPVELLAGFMYGPWGGLLFCLAGSALGCMLVFLLVRRFGKKLIQRMCDSEKVQKLRFMKTEKNKEFLLFILFFIPGTPKDVLTYLSPLLGISLPRFLIITTIAKIPSIITSTFAGNFLGEGKIVSMIILYGVTAVVSIAGILVHNRLVRKKETQALSSQDEDL